MSAPRMTDEQWRDDVMELRRRTSVWPYVERIVNETARLRALEPQQAAEIERLKGDNERLESERDRAENELAVERSCKYDAELARDRAEAEVERLTKAANTHAEAWKQAQAEAERLKAELEAARYADDNTRAFTQTFCETVEEAERRANTPAGGQSVPNHMDFAHVLPSTRGQLRWWAKCGRAALKGESSILLARATERAEKAEEKLKALRAAAVKACTLCNGTGSFLPHCDFCEDSGHDHECPPRQQCSHPFLPAELKEGTS